MGHKGMVFGAVALAATVLMTVPGSADVGSDKATLQHIRQLSGRYHSVTQAEKAGYVLDDHCAESPLGAMGYHYVKTIDGVFDIDHPEALLYASKENGGLRLVGVEYMVRDADQNLATTNDRPALAGHPFDGPMPGHNPGMPIHYDLHVWAWADNPAGSFATWNLAITCP